MINIGFFLGENDEHWNGGINYYNNLFLILKNSGIYKPIVFTSKKSRKTFEKKLLDNVEIKECNFMTSGTISFYLWKIVFYYFHYSLFVDRLTKKHNIKFVSHSSRIPMNVNSKINSCPWIPDLQFLHYPEFFNKITNKRLAYIFKFIGKTATTLLFSSDDSKNDYCLLDPQINRNKLKTFHFVVRPNSQLPNISDDILTKYNVEKYKYFIVTNQFWKHKNHIIVVEAINELLKNYHNLPYKFIFTGLLDDPRDPLVSTTIKDKIKEYKLNAYIQLTDAIPYFDVISLQKYSIAVIQPSLFEGWNTAVEECKNVGKKIILSNIEVHKEQNPENVIFFDPKNSYELAEIINKVYNSFNLDVESDYYRKAIEKQECNWTSFSEEYLKLIQDNIK